MRATITRKRFTYTRSKPLICRSTTYSVVCGARPQGATNFGELRKGEVPKTHHGQNSGAVELHPSVTIPGQQGTEVQNGRSSTLGCTSHRVLTPAELPAVWLVAFEQEIAESARQSLEQQKNLMAEQVRLNAKFDPS